MSKEEANKNNVKPQVETEIVTINDFKSMLIGMDLILGDQWTPDEGQWRRIRKKIDALIETHGKPVDSTRNVSETQLLRSFPTWPVPNVPTNVPGESTPGESALIPPAGPLIPPSVADGSGTKVKTPDIDSTTGYNTPFV